MAERVAMEIEDWKSIRKHYQLEDSEAAFGRFLSTEMSRFSLSWSVVVPLSHPSFAWGERHKFSARVRTFCKDLC